MMMRGADQSFGAENEVSRYVRRANLTAEVLFRGKWKLQILCAMRSGPVRLGQLARIVPGASKKMLTQNLRQLEADGIVVRKDMSDLVLHIEYELAESTREGVCALLDHLAKWGGLQFGKLGNDKK
ncbi:winged helix-turn-helix transcriptional regulator [Tunturiibacter psychrotolerans]|uniref:winged helix-turn-helix transcriptional regulator n=1 Tax=Tunturiibacter psychrotolerans TaxID=3069686 RepID=UPI003D1FB040